MEARQQPLAAQGPRDQEPWEPKLLEQYRTTANLVTASERRLDALMFAFFATETALFVAFAWIISFWDFRHGDAWLMVDLRVLPFFVPVIGMFVSTVWLAATVRRQMVLRLFYFRLRQIERDTALDRSGVFSSASKYWDGEPIPDSAGEETLHFLKGADAAMGRIPTRVHAWVLPLLFFLLFLYLLIGLYVAVAGQA